MVLNYDSIILFLLGLGISYIVARLISIFVYRVLYDYNLKDFLKKFKFEEAVFGVDLINLIRIFTFWYIFLIGITTSAYYSNINEVYIVFKNYIIPYFFKSSYGFLIIIIGFWLSYLIKERIEYENFKFSNLLSKLIYYIMIYMIVVSVLPNFGIDNKIFLDVFKYFIVGISFGIWMALGIGFGLVLKKYLEKELNN